MTRGARSEQGIRFWAVMHQPCQQRPAGKRLPTRLFSSCSAGSKRENASTPAEQASTPPFARSVVRMSLPFKLSGVSSKPHRICMVSNGNRCCARSWKGFAPVVSAYYAKHGLPQVAERGASLVRQGVHLNYQRTHSWTSAALRSVSPKTSSVSAPALMGQLGVPARLARRRMASKWSMSEAVCFSAAARALALAAA